MTNADRKSVRSQNNHSRMGDTIGEKDLNIEMDAISTKV